MKSWLIQFMALAGLLLPATFVLADEDSTVTMEYYYQIKWGHQDEFIELYKKNHLPLLGVLLKTGHMLSVVTDRPTLHLPEDRRWDYRVTIVFRDAHAALSDPPEEWEQAKTRLYPNQDLFKQEESQRFQLLEAHWDVAISAVVLE